MKEESPDKLIIKLLKDKFNYKEFELNKINKRLKFFNKKIKEL